MIFIFFDLRGAGREAVNIVDYLGGDSRIVTKQHLIAPGGDE
ncbi:hypothetical protein [Frankia sp. AgPm24]|nr:hypothetical protein [Frankia sp. AgPm24]